ncbi:polysaccharide deacetylase family protein [Paenibacillus puldeungensis]|uniref:Polysaccharide deacetylase family protein n=1 Tax=Paenibacillus puldeungensis TaxID=696536 RepID=A0ABW3RZB3_9BACL
MKKSVMILISIGMLFYSHALIADGSPLKKDRFFYEQKGDIVWEVKTHQKMVAITFDDGPDPIETTEILNELKKYNAKCTFFVLGKKVETYPEIASRIIKEGHELANHTYNHAYFKGESGEDIVKELMKTERVITGVSGKGSKFFRPPGGVYSDSVVNAAKQVGLKIILWSWHQDTRDWKKPGAHVIKKQVMKNLRNGDIILMHDSVSGKSQTKEALSQILPELMKKGYRVVTVSELIKSQEAQEIEIGNYFYP